jgi:anthranilate phosphoribosyltransferase
MGRPLKEVLESLLARQDLSEQQAFELLVSLTDAELPPAMAGALLTALRAKGVTAEEVRGFARGMRSLARHPVIRPGAPVADVVGTGGDSSHSFNLSTGAALLAAAAGVRIVKHGNRSVSSRSGSADVLEHLGLKLPLDEQAVDGCLQATGFTFLFAPHYHPAMKAIAPVRAALGIRTVFNLLGPLTNPAEAPYGVVGAWSLEVAALMADTLSGLPIARMFVVHGETGWDEPTPAAPFALFDVRPGEVSRSRRDASDFGLAACSTADLRGADARHNAARLAAVLRGEDRGAHRDALVMGAALVLEVTGMAAGPREAAVMAAASIDDGRAARTLEALARFGAEGAG